MSALNVERFSFAYEDKPIFKDASICLESGKIYLLTGENGTGKTTLMRILSGLRECENIGSLVFDGKKYDSFKELKTEVMYVGDNPYLYEYLTGRENINLLCDIFGIKDKSEVAVNIHEFCLDNELNKMVKEYSLGMRYKLFFAVAMCAKTSVMLLDEPFSSLDAHSKEYAQKLLCEYVKKGGRVLLSTHIDQYIKKYSSNHYHIIEERLEYYEGKEC